MSEILSKVKELQEKISGLKSRVNLASKQGEIKSLESEMNEPSFWQDRARARFISQQVADLKNEVAVWENLEREANDLLALAWEDDQDKTVDLTPEVAEQFNKISRRFAELELQTVLTGKYDALNAVISIYAGAGGTEAQDWAEMLLRMYLRFCEKRKWQAKVIDESRGLEAGLKSVTLEIKGSYVYGYLKAESGVHRLVRLSPFDADHARHTSFAMAEVTPEVEQASFEIKDEDLKIETNTATGHGGQSVNTTYSAIRITHLPTGIKTSCQNERSQSQNKETAMKVLKGKLAKYYETQVEEERLRLRGELTEAAWGNQIRSYVLHPYKMVKDHRTDYEEHDPERVLGGELDNFIEQYLKSQVK
ncbi:MAG: peptide chain release factor 2 [Candidatus Komeilibacteria bacterium]|nr:peptide chain release factor 2 [Candidatus Komeilibacteria bacterium]